MTIQQKLIVTVSILCLGILATIFFIIVPTMQEIITINDRIHDQRVDLERKYLEGQLRHKALEDFELIKNKKDALIEPFVLPGDELKFVTYLENIAEQNNIEQTITLDQISTTQPNKATPVDIKLVLQGQLLDTLRYLQLLEASTYYISFDTVRMNPISRTNTASEIIQVTLEGAVFSYHETNDLDS